MSNINSTKPQTLGENTNCEGIERNKGTKTNYTEEEFNQLFPIVDVKSFTPNDRFLNHRPETNNQERVKIAVLRAIHSAERKNFRRPIIDPSVDDRGNIYFKKGSMPGINHSVRWWNAHACKFMPSKKSRMGTLQEYDAFLGTIIKYLVEEKSYQICKAWRLVCDDSYLLGNYYNNSISKHALEPTGSVGAGKWFDLANTFKMITQFGAINDNLIVGGCYCSDSRFTSLADIRRVSDYESEYWNGLGWIILDV